MSDKLTVKQRLSTGEVVFGPWCVIPSGAVMNIIASAGFDFVIIDMEHGPASFETAEEMIRAAETKNVSTIVRLGLINEEYILKSLDLGASGILTAHVETAEDAREVVALSKYHPLGKRGFSPYTRAGGYIGGDITMHSKIQNEHTLTGVIIEGKTGLENIDAILETEHIDLIYIGAYDLSQALGMPGEVGHPKIRVYMKKYVQKIRDAGIAAGGFVAKNKDDMAWMIDIGMQFVTYMPDCLAFLTHLRSAVDNFKKIKQ